MNNYDKLSLISQDYVNVGYRTFDKSTWRRSLQQIYKGPINDDNDPHIWHDFIILVPIITSVKNESWRVSLRVMHRIRSETLGETLWREKSRQESCQESRIGPWLSPRLFFFTRVATGTGVNLDRFERWWGNGQLTLKCNLRIQQAYNHPVPRECLSSPLQSRIRDIIRQLTKIL